MAERHVRVFAELTVSTEVNLVLYDDDTASGVFDQVLSEGLKQYMKDYDPDIGYSVPKAKITLVEKVMETG